jgi:hypothetical protein
MESVMKDVKVKPARAKARPAPKPAAEPVAAKAPARRALPKAVPAETPVVVAAPVVEAVTAPAAPVETPIEAAPAPAPQAEEAPAPTLVETLVAPLAALDLAPAAPAPEVLLKPVAAVLETGTEGARTLYAKAQETNATLRSAMTESATAATRGLVELNGQVLDLVRAQSDATLAAWRSVLTAGSMSEAIRVQTSGVRQVYETSAQHWKAIAETAGRTAEAAMRPMQSALGPR